MTNNTLEALYGEIYSGIVVPDDDYRAIRRAVLDLPSTLQILDTEAPGTAEGTS